MDTDDAASNFYASLSVLQGAVEHKAISVKFDNSDHNYAMQDAGDGKKKVAEQLDILDAKYRQAYRESLDEQRDCTEDRVSEPHSCQTETDQPDAHVSSEVIMEVSQRSHHCLNETRVERISAEYFFESMDNSYSDENNEAVDKVTETQQLDENFDVHSKCRRAKCQHGNLRCSVRLYSYTHEARCCDNHESVELPSDTIPPETEKKKSRKAHLQDRFAYYTDGTTCWNPPVFLGQRSYVPQITRPMQKFRHFHNNVLKSLVREAVTRELRASVHTSFENQAIKLGVPLEDIELFRLWDYNLDIIQKTWFTDVKMRKLLLANGRIEWARKMPGLLRALSSLKENLNKITSEIVEEKLLDSKLQADWLFVSAQMLIRANRTLSPEACKRLWQNAFSPRFSMPATWTQQEFSKLKALSLKAGKRNFIKIAKIMGPKFSPFLCLKMFVKYIRPTIEEMESENDDDVYAVWKRDEVREDFETCMDMYNGSFRCSALWLKHAYDVDFTPRFLIHQHEKYKIGQFSLHEDAILVVIDEIIQEHNLISYTFHDFLPWRPQRAWNHRLDSIRFPHRTTSGGRNYWSENEDRRLLQLAKKLKRDWVQIANHFVIPRRSRKAIQARHTLLAHVLKKSTLEEFHSRKYEPFQAPFYYMRKTLSFLEELDESRSGLPTVTDPDTGLVYRLFRQCNESFKMNSLILNASKSKTLNLYPQPEHIRNLLLEIPQFYFEQAVEKIHLFFSAVGIPASLPS